MACRIRMGGVGRLALGLALALTACGSEASSDEDAGSSSTTGAEGAAEGGVTEDAPALTTTSTSTTTGGSTTWSSTSLGGSTGSVEDTFFGMSDDMPLVADIPDIKRGLLDDGTLVLIEHVRTTTTRASLGGPGWIYVQDPNVDEHMGLRVTLQDGEVPPLADHEVYLEGVVVYDEQGWQLALDVALTSDQQPSPPARHVRVATLTGPDAALLDDSVVDVVEPSALVVTRRGPVSGTVLVGAAAQSSGALLVDLRPFGLDVAAPPPPPGTHLSRLRGVVEIGGPRPTILPRSVDDFVVSR